MRILKWIAYGIGALVVLVLLSLAVLVWMVDPNRFKPRIEAEVKKATGRDFALVGDIQVGFYPWLALRTGPGRFGNPPGFSAEPMASWQSMQLGAKLIPLVRGELVVDRVRLSGADVRLVRHADGSANWQGIGSGEPAPPGKPARRITVDGVDLENSRLLFIDEGVPRRVEVTEFALTTDELAADRPFTDTRISGKLHMDGFVAGGVPFELEVPKAALTQDYSRLELPEFSLKFAVLEAKGAVAGSLGESPRLAGKLASNAFDPRALLAAVGIEAPKTTDPHALSRLQFATDWHLDAGAMSVDPLTLLLDDTRFSGKFHRGAGEDPIGDFTLRGDALNLSRYIPPTDPDSEPFVLPTAALRSLKFRGVVELDQATLDDVVMNGVTLRLLLDENGLRSAEQPR
ncbi:MAG TPA: AsmA family protein [Steroidobacteraceae bacterium]|nr:AsmA family protein [Steroidobacteraceae bacterium]